MPFPYLAVRWTLVGVVAVTLMTSAANAFGSAVSVEIEDGVGLLEYNAAPGEMNDVQVSRTGDTFTIIDEGAVINAGSGCVQVSEHEVSCSSADEGSFFEGWVETSSRRPPRRRAGREAQRREGERSSDGVPSLLCSG